LSENSRNTIQKQAVLDTIKSMRTHPSVDELHCEIRKTYPSISKATVYRNVNQLAQKGTILQIAVAGDVMRYDGCTDFHYHLACDDCGRVLDVHTDFQADAIEDLTAFVEGQDGHKIKETMVLFRGICADCR